MPLLHHTTTLADGARVRLRLPHAGDRPGLHALHARLGVAADELELARAVRFDPRRRAVACATAWHGAAETIVGYGAIDNGADAPDLLVCDDGLAPGVRDLLADALRAHAAAA